MFGILEGEQKYILNWLIFNIKYIYNIKILKKDMHVNAIKHILRNKFQTESIFTLKIASSTNPLMFG